MKKSAASILFLAGLSGLILTLIFAVSSHMLNGKPDAQSGAWLNIGTETQMLATLGLLGSSMLAQFGTHRFAIFSSVFMVSGVIFFCGGLYIMALNSPDALGWARALIPYGGGAIILAWTVLIIGSFQSMVRLQRQSDRYL